jgi:hypothetical protein
MLSRFDYEEMPIKTGNHQSPLHLSFDHTGRAQRKAAAWTVHSDSEDSPSDREVFFILRL